jgi:alpha-L-rhamnosidase
MINWATMLGEWLEVGSGGSANRTPRVLTCTQAFYRCAAVVAKTAAVLGYASDEIIYSELAEKVAAAFNEEYLDKETGLLAKDSQSAYAMSLVLGMVPPGLEAKVFQQLVKNLEERGGHLSTGIVGTWFLYKALGQYGRPDLAYQAITAKGFPGFEHMLTRVNDKTPVPSKTIWEDWGGVSSLAHPVQGAVVSFFYEYLAGIQAIEPGFKRFAVRPAVVGDLSWVQAKLNTSYGTIQSSWKKEEGNTIYTIHVPTNTTAEVTLPGGEIQTIGSGTYTFTIADKKKKGK